MTPTRPDTTVPKRAPALYITGRPERDLAPYTFRLPCPPAWDDRPPCAWAAERRAKKVYFAALDAMRTGVVSPEHLTKLRRLLAEVKSRTAGAALAQLERVFDAVSRNLDQTPLLPAPIRLAELTTTAPRRSLSTTLRDAQTRYAWTLEWLRTRGYFDGSDETMRWRFDHIGVPRPAE